MVYENKCEDDHLAGSPAGLLILFLPSDPGDTNIRFSQNIGRICEIIDKLLQALLNLNKSSIGVCPVHPPPTTHPQQLYLAVSQLPVVRSEHVRTLFDSTQSQESESEVCARKFYAATRIKTHLDNTLYLSSLWSDLSK